jgi:uncharacterized protein (DUF302 family)
VSEVLVKDYAYLVTLDLPYEHAVQRVTAALKEEGFGVLTEIDVKATLKQKLDVDFRKYVILGACNPQLAYKALSTERTVGLLLPCNVIVYEEDGGSVVGILSPIAMMDVTDNPDLDPVAREAQERLKRVAAALQG